MKSVLISIKPKWCELIASGIKTIEIRKTKPKLDTPFKCYIYCTLNGTSKMSLEEYFNGEWHKKKSKVIGEFICDEIIDAFDLAGSEFYAASCMDIAEWLKYTDGHKGKVWCWHISALKMYDKPKELGAFYTKCRMDCELCKMRGYTRVNVDEFDMDCKSDWINHKPILRPPQSWCYVEEAK